MFTYRSVLNFWATSRTSFWNGVFLINGSTDFWNLRISLSACVPGLNRCGFLTPATGADFLAFLGASALRGAPPPVDFLAVDLVLAPVMAKLLEAPTSALSKSSEKMLKQEAKTKLRKKLKES